MIRRWIYFIAFYGVLGIAGWIVFRLAVVFALAYGWSR